MNRKCINAICKEGKRNEKGKEKKSKRKESISGIDSGNTLFNRRITNAQRDLYIINRDF